MATITIIPSVRLYRTGVKTTQADGSIKSIALHQGSLDGACAVYSTIISLMCLYNPQNEMFVRFGTKRS